MAITATSPVVAPPPEPPPEEIAPSEDPGDLPAYDYGTDTEDVAPGYISDAELLAWLQAKSADKYGALDQLMDASNQRSKLIQDLSHLKETLANPTLDPADAVREIESIQAAYAGTEHAEELARVLEPLGAQARFYAGALGTLERQLDLSTEAAEALENATQNAANDLAELSTGTDAPESPAAPEPRKEADPNFVQQAKSFYSAELTEAAKGIDATIKSLEHDDQIALVQIQAVMSDIRETAQLTSNILASRSQMTDGIVANLRA